MSRKNIEAALQAANPVEAQPRVDAGAVDNETLSRMNNALCEFAMRWEVDGDYMRCRKCRRNCCASYAADDFQHASDCTSAGKAESKPWQTFVSLLTPIAPPLPDWLETLAVDYLNGRGYSKAVAKAKRIRALAAQPMGGGIKEGLCDPVPGVRFGHHPDPAIDFCVEVETLSARLFNAKRGIAKPGTNPESVKEIAAAIERALQFRVGGDEGAMKAKDALRQLAQEAAPQPTGASVEGEAVAARQAWYEEQIAEAESNWIDQWQERYEDGDDVPDKEHFIALWLAERNSPTPSSEAGGEWPAKAVSWRYRDTDRHGKWLPWTEMGSANALAIAIKHTKEGRGYQAQTLGVIHEEGRSHAD